LLTKGHAVLSTSFQLDRLEGTADSPGSIFGVSVTTGREPDEPDEPDRETSKEVAAVAEEGAAVVTAATVDVAAAEAAAAGKAVDAEDAADAAADKAAMSGTAAVAVAFCRSRDNKAESVAGMCKPGSMEVCAPEQAGTSWA